jgi:hypothetical protein
MSETLDPVAIELDQRQLSVAILAYFIALHDFLEGEDSRVASAVRQSDGLLRARQQANNRLPPSAHLLMRKLDVVLKRGLRSRTGTVGSLPEKPDHDSPAVGQRRK